MASVNCFGFVVSLLKLLEKVSQPRGQRSLNGVLVDGGAARLPAEYRSIVRGAESIRGRRVRAWGSIPTGAQRQVESGTRRSGELCKPVNAGCAFGRRNLEPRRKVEGTQRELWPPEFQCIEWGSGMNALQNWRTEAKALPGPSPITFEPSEMPAARGLISDGR